MATTGTYDDNDGRPQLRFERTFPHSPDAVWNAITDPAQLGRWFPTSVEFALLETGAPITFRFEDDAYPSLEGEFREVRPGVRLVFTWGEDLLSFELAPQNQGRRCRLAFSVSLDAAGKAARDGAGWESCLDWLDAVLAGEPVQRPAPSERWQAYYDAYRGQGFPATAELPG
jgi:uncharacterized protein YndB with AHSA1/START domain